MTTLRPVTFLLLAALLAAASCRERKQLTTAKSNAIEFAKARCECEKQNRKTPPGDVTRCSEDMARTTRYLKINFEFNSFSDDDKRAITQAGDDVFKKCMAEP